MKKMIVISGKQYSGKDTLARILLENFKDFVRIGIGDAIKLKYAKEHKLTFEEIEKNKSEYRADLIKLGNWGREQDPDFWLKTIIDMPQNVIVPDVRVVHEAQLFKSCGAYLIRVEASYEARSKRAIVTNADDATETALDNYNGFNAIVHNESDYEHLVIEAEALLPKIKEFFN